MTDITTRLTWRKNGRYRDLFAGRIQIGWAHMYLSWPALTASPKSGAVTELWTGHLHAAECATIDTEPTRTLRETKAALETAAREAMEGKL